MMIVLDVRIKFGQKIDEKKTMTTAPEIASVTNRFVTEVGNFHCLSRIRVSSTRSPFVDLVNLCKEKLHENGNGRN